MATTSINNYLRGGDSLARLQAHAGRLLRLQRQLAEDRKSTRLNSSH